MKELKFPLVPFNSDLLHEELLAELGEPLFLGVSSDSTNIRVILLSNPSPAQETAIANIISSHDPDGLSQIELEEQAVEVNSADVINRLINAGLRDKTPDEIYTQLQNQIDSWSALADAKSDLREWIPLMAAAIVWLSSRK